MAGGVLELDMGKFPNSGWGLEGSLPNVGTNYFTKNIHLIYD
jgi:hypothetical protein